MDANPRLYAVGVVLLTVALSVGATSAIGFAHEQDHQKDRRLVDALQVLQAIGLRIVFSSATVTPDLRVQVEPRAFRSSGVQGAEIESRSCPELLNF